MSTNIMMKEDLEQCFIGMILILSLCIAYFYHILMPALSIFWVKNQKNGKLNEKIFWQAPKNIFFTNLI